MKPAAVRAFCLKLPGATYDLKWGADHVYSVGDKMFAVVGPEGNVGFKVDDNRFLELTDIDGIIPAPYLARAKWVLVKRLTALPEEELKALIVRSHEIILGKLTKKRQQEIRGK